MYIKTFAFIALLFTLTACTGKNDITSPSPLPTQEQVVMPSSPEPPIAITPSPSIELSPAPVTQPPTPQTTHPEPTPDTSPRTLFTVLDVQVFPPEQDFDDDEFTAFYNEFITAVRNRDMEFIDSILDENIWLSYGGAGGKEDFYRIWFGEHADLDLWAVLEEIIVLGGVYYPSFRLGGYTEEVKCFIAPYTFRYDDFCDIDISAFNLYFIINNDVNVYANGDLSSDVIGTLNYNAVEYHFSDYGNSFWYLSEDDFVSITLLSGEVGYIQKRHLRSPVDFRFYFVNADGAWLMDMFIAGD